VVDLRPSAALAIYTTLCLLADEQSDAEVSVSISSLAGTAGVRHSTAFKAIKILERLGLIEIVHFHFVHKNRQVPAELAWAIFKRDGYRCQYCGCDDGPFQVDHVIPMAKGGLSSSDNL
jgi:hypothetical protein